MLGKTKTNFFRRFPNIFLSTRFAGDAVNYVAGFTSGRGIHYDFFVGDGALHDITRNHIRTGHAENIRAFLYAWCL